MACGWALDWHDLRPALDYWRMYEGGFEEGLRQGRGVLRFSNGEWFEGQFRAGLPWGQGCWHGLRGSVRALWAAGVRM